MTVFILTVTATVSGMTLITQAADSPSPPSEKVLMVFCASPNDPAWTIDVIGDENFRILRNGTVAFMIDYNGIGYFDNDFLPADNNVCNLGSPSYRWENIYIAGGSIHLGNLTLWDRDNCLATRHFTTMGKNGEAGYLRIAHGIAPTENQAGYLQIFAGSDDNLHLLESGGAERLMVLLESDGSLYIDGNTFVVDNANNRVGIGTTAPDSIFHIKANVPGTVGSHPAGQLIIQDPDDTVFGNAVITGYESDGAGNPDQQLWYLGSSSSSNSNIIFLNRRNAKLQLGTNGASHLTILGNGNVGIGTSTPDNKLTVSGDAHITGKLYADGGVDPPYVSYTQETHKSIREYAQSVSSDEVMMFWNSEAHRMEVYVISEDTFYTITGERVVD